MNTSPTSTKTTMAMINTARRRVRGGGGVLVPKAGKSSLSLVTDSSESALPAQSAYFTGFAPGLLLRQRRTEGVADGTERAQETQ
jgi:hypothetical protein